MARKHDQSDLAAFLDSSLSCRAEFFIWSDLKMGKVTRKSLLRLPWAVDEPGVED